MMVKTTGPAISTKASGTLAGQLTFSNWKGRGYLKNRPQPKQPRTPKQVAMRAIMSWLASQWIELSAFQKATWPTPAQRDGLSPFNAYQKYNLNRWRNFHAPSQIWPATEAGSPASWTDIDAQGVVRGVRIHFTITDVRNSWGIPIYRIPDPGTAKQWNLLRFIEPTSPDGYHDWVDTPLDPGTYYYRIGDFTTTGYMWLGDVYRSATVTQ